MNEEEMFTSRDLSLVATLVCLGFKIEDTQLEQEGRNVRMIAYWSIKNTPMLKEARRKYTAGELLVEPKMLIQTLQALKADAISLTREATIRS